VHTFKLYNQYKPFVGERLIRNAIRVKNWKNPGMVPLYCSYDANNASLFMTVNQLLSCLHTFVELNSLWQSQKWETTLSWGVASHWYESSLSPLASEEMVCVW